MVTESYSKLLQILASGSPAIVKDHIDAMRKEGRLNDVIIGLLESWSENVNSDNLAVAEGADLDLSGLSILMRHVQINELDALVEKLAKSEVKGSLEAMISKGGADFVASLDIESNPENAFALLLMINVVGNEYKKEILLAIQDANFDIFLTDPDLRRLFRYTIENYMDSVGKEEELEIQTLLACEALAKSEALDSDKGDEYMSALDILMERIASNKISTTELNFAIGMMPMLALTIAQNFTNLPSRVQSNLAENIFPSLGNTPLGRLCNDIVESRSSYKVDLPGEKAPNPKPVSDDLDKAIKDANVKIAKVKEDVKVGKIDIKEAKVEIDQIVKPVVAIAVVDSQKSIDEIAATKAKAMKVVDVKASESISSAAIPIVDAAIDGAKSAIDSIGRS